MRRTNQSTRKLGSSSGQFRRQPHRHVEEVAGGGQQDLHVKQHARPADVVEVIDQLATDAVEVGVRRKAELGQAQVDRQRTLYGLRDQEQEVVLDVKTAVDELEKSKLKLDVARLARDLAARTLEAEVRKRELGENTLFLVLEAQATLAAAELSFVRASVNYQKAVTGMARATGTLLEKHNVRITDTH